MSLTQTVSGITKLITVIYRQIRGLEQILRIYFGSLNKLKKG